MSQFNRKPSPPKNGKTKRIHRAPHDKDHPYTQISSQLLEDAQLSWAAKGLLCYLLNKPDDWAIYQDELHHHAANGQWATRMALKELKDKGYVQRVFLRNHDGKLLGNELHVTENPKVHHVEKPSCGKTTIRENHHVDFHNLPNTDLPNTDLIPNNHSPRTEVSEQNKIIKLKQADKPTKLRRGGF
jgi:hypothetical protein